MRRCAHPGTRTPYPWSGFFPRPAGMPHGARISRRSPSPVPSLSSFIPPGPASRRRKRAPKRRRPGSAGLWPPPLWPTKTSLHPNDYGMHSFHRQSARELPIVSAPLARCVLTASWTYRYSEQHSNVLPSVQIVDETHAGPVLLSPTPYRRQGHGALQNNAFIAPSGCLDLSL